MSDFYERYRHMYEGFDDEKRLTMYRRVKRGDWLFTCKLEAIQFDTWDEPKNYSDYNPIWMTEKTETERALFFEFGHYNTMEGSHHSSNNCGLWVVTPAYAKWFNEVVKPVAARLWDEQTSDISYDEMVERLAVESGIRFEGA